MSGKKRRNMNEEVKDEKKVKQEDGEDSLEDALTKELECVVCLQFMVSEARRPLFCGNGNVCCSSCFRCNTFFSYFS